jgi:hypothetical protein
MATTPLVLRSYRQSVLARAGALAVAHGPAVGRWARRAARKARTTVLQVGGLGAITAAAWIVAVPLGLFVGGLALLLLEPLTGDVDAP